MQLSVVQTLREYLWPPYLRTNARATCVCGARRRWIPKRLWRVTDKETDLIFPKYFYRCPECRSFSAVNLYFPTEKYKEMPLDWMGVNQTKQRLNDTRMSWIAQHASLPENAIVFDLGAGEGCFSHTFAAANLNSVVFAVEADARIREPFYTTNSRIVFVPMYIETFLRPSLVGDQHPNLVVLTDVLEHVLAPEQLLNEVARVLAPGGWAYLTIPDANTFGPPFPYPASPGTIEWPRANITCQHLWMMEPTTFAKIVSASLDVVAETHFETDIRKNSVYTTILARKPD